MHDYHRQAHHKWLGLRRACKEAAIAILQPGAPEGQIAVVTEKIFVQAAAMAIGSGAVENIEQHADSYQQALNALKQQHATPSARQSVKQSTPQPDQRNDTSSPGQLLD